ncbi:Uncharacterized protein Rs2_46661 [Raphanus sativus]|nr:Uncharacterized protein Rs2_46661 [Raphanus sativus]
MSETNQASPAQDAPALTQTFIEGFSSFQDKMERRRAEMESSVAGPSATSVPTSMVPTLGSDIALTLDPAVLALGPDVTPVPISTIPASGSDVPLPAGEIVVPEQAPDVQTRPEGSPFAPRAGVAGSAKRKRCTKSEEGEVSAKLSQHRSKAPRLCFNRLRALISDLERDLGKTVSSLFKAKEEKKSKSSEVRRLKRRIQRFEEMGACTATELASPSSSGTLVPSSEIPEVQDAGIVADKGGEEVGEGDGEAVPASGESENEGGVPEDA